MNLSKKNSLVQGSVTLAIDAKAKEMRASGLDVVSFGAGEPDFATPEYISEAAKQAIDGGKTKYTAASGMPALKEVIASSVSKKLGITVSPQSVVVSNGAKQALFNSLQMICDPGDEVIIFSPYWVSYPELVRMAGATPVFVKTKTDEDFALDVQSFKNAITKKTKAVILNTPSNPTGAVLSKDDVQAVADEAVKNDFFIISDEIYDALVYDGAKHFSPMQVSDEARARTIYINGFSKSYAMTGWRVGYSVCDEKIAKLLGAFQSHATGNVNSIAQQACITALSSENKEFEKMFSAFSSRREFMVRTVNESGILSCKMPKGAFYVMVNVSAVLGKEYKGEKIENSMQFASALLDAKQVAVVPGGPFGLEGYIRLSYATSMENIQKGLKRICEFAEELKNN